MSSFHYLKTQEWRDDNLLLVSREQFLHGRMFSDDLGGNRPGENTKYRKRKSTDITSIEGHIPITRARSIFSIVLSVRSSRLGGQSVPTLVPHGYYTLPYISFPIFSPRSDHGTQWLYLPSITSTTTESSRAAYIETPPPQCSSLFSSLHLHQSPSKSESMPQLEAPSCISLENHHLVSHRFSARDSDHRPVKEGI